MENKKIQDERDFYITLSGILLICVIFLFLLLIVRHPQETFNERWETYFILEEKQMNDAIKNYCEKTKTANITAAIFSNGQWVCYYSGVKR